MSSAVHTIVISDLHLTEIEPQDPARPTWKRHKHADLSIDGCLVRFLDHIHARTPGPVELILNGDIFDFDAVLAVPTDRRFPVNWLERLRGLNSEEAKSHYKLERILEQHPDFVARLRAWIRDGHSLVLVVGNHDVELLWPLTQRLLREALDPPAERQDAFRICEWFYLSQGDTLVEHGSQYDAYCVCPDPLHPVIKLGKRRLMRVPFGNIAGRLMLNGMGLFNPYVESTFIKPLHEYVVFFFREVVRVQPLLAWSWLWGAVATGVVTIRNGLLPSERDPLTMAARERDAAARANADPDTLRALRVLRVHPAALNPWKVLEELWLDRALIFAILAFVSFQTVGFLNIFAHVSPLWAGLLFLLLLPPFVFYARSVNSDVENTNRALRKRMPTALRLAGTTRAVIGHTHVEGHTIHGETELLNTGTWSPAFEDTACTKPFGRKCFAWIHPGEDGTSRVAELREWMDPSCARIDAEVIDQEARRRLGKLTQLIPGRR